MTFIEKSRIFNLLNKTWVVSAYPDILSSSYFACVPTITAYSTETIANITRGITDYVIVETVWSTNINWYFRAWLTEEFAKNGNYYADADVGDSNSTSLGWTSTLLPLVQEYDFTTTFRIASVEKFSAGLSIWWTCTRAPLFNFLNVRYSDYSIDWTWNATILVGLMNTSWTITNIWELNCSTSTNNVIETSLTVLCPPTTETFTPQVTSEWDRIVLDITMNANLNVLVAPSWGGIGTNTTTATFYFWTIWSPDNLTQTTAFRPIQISIE